jgi:hypothetical protein
MKHPRDDNIGKILALTSREPIIFFAIKLSADPALQLSDVAH